MAIKLHYRTITGYRELPPKWRIVEPGGREDAGRQYLEQVDAAINLSSQYVGDRGDQDDIVSMVFANQLLQLGAASYVQARLIAERRESARRHREDIRWRLAQLVEHRPMKPVVDGKLNDVEKQIIDLEKQMRLIDVTEWRDLMELRSGLVEQRQKYRATQARMNYLAGGYAGAS